jgi:hypothetical protein
MALTAQGKNRGHVDPTAADRAAEVSRLGNEFCVAEQD